MRSWSVYSIYVYAHFTNSTLDPKPDKKAEHRVDKGVGSQRGFEICLLALTRSLRPN